MKHHKKKKPANSIVSAAAILAILGISIDSNAQGTEEVVNINSVKGVAQVKQLSDGSLELVLENGEIVKISAEDVSVNGADILVKADALTALAEAGALTETASLVSNNNLLIGGVIAGVAGIAAASSGGGGGGGDDVVAPVDEAAPIDVDPVDVDPVDVDPVDVDPVDVDPVAIGATEGNDNLVGTPDIDVCLLYTSPSPRD